MSAWTVYVTCTLCSTSAAKCEHADHLEAGRQAEAAARDAGFLELPAVNGDRRRTKGHWLCKLCVADVLAARPS